VDRLLGVDGRSVEPIIPPQKTRERGASG